MRKFLIAIRTFLFKVESMLHVHYHCKYQCCIILHISIIYYVYVYVENVLYLLLY